MSTRQKLPLNKAVLKKLVDENCCYVDKTPYIKQLLDDGAGYWFLSRPRRFGKSLFLDTLRAAFAGEKELFKGLFLEKNWDWSIKYPVVTISFGGGTAKSSEELNTIFFELLNVQAEEYDIVLSQITISGRFSELLRKLYKKFKLGVVVLVDEYDKPLLDNLTKDIVDEIREELSGFYSVLKDSDKYLKFVFLTGVSKFSKTSIFSKLNNLIDISLEPKYADICGYTQKDLETVFADYLHDVDLDKVRQWYNGYNFLGSNVYNPYDVLLFLLNKRYQCYWFRTGTPTFLLDLIKDKKYFLPDLNNIEINEFQMEEFDIHSIKLDVLLFQAGYLTIKRVYTVGEDRYYSLSFPNKEVKKGLNAYLVRMFFGDGTEATHISKLSQIIYLSLDANNPAPLEKAFFSFFASIPHQWYVKNNIAHYEGYYCCAFYSFFAALDLTIKPEDMTNKGRIDFTVIMEKGVFIFEIKMKSNPKNAIVQIKERKYHEKYLSENKEIFLIGIEFDEEERNLSKFEVEKIMDYLK